MRSFNLIGLLLVRLLRGPTRLTRVAPHPYQGPIDPASIRIKNFGQMDDRFYRGAYPRKGDFRALAALGVNTVVDLRKEADGLERSHVEELGMQYINIPMRDTEYPRSEHINAFLNLTKDSTAGKFFVHCAGGRHRTGVIGAVYRLNINRWNYDQAYSEMKSYDFYTRWGHRPLKTFVQDFARQLNINNPPARSKSSCHHNSRKFQ